MMHLFFLPPQSSPDVKLDGTPARCFNKGQQCRDVLQSTNGSNLHKKKFKLPKGLKIIDFSLNLGDLLMLV